jgi:uncharacterized protein (TIGR00290 family)
MNKAVVFWSGGKDAAMALYRAIQNPEIQVVGLVTTLNKEVNETAVHKIPEAVLERQAQQTGLPLRKMWVNAMPDNLEYEQALSEVYSQLKEEGINTVIYGDIFLEDIKTYREGLLQKAGLRPMFPLWKMDPAKLMKDFVNSGFKAIVCQVNSAALTGDYLGRELNSHFLDDLPGGVDPAGENGEYHTFCFDGPVFKEPVNFKTVARHFSSLPLSSKDQRDTHTFGYIDIR